jgi:hypothetical protein
MREIGCDDESYRAASDRAGAQKLISGDFLSFDDHNGNRWNGFLLDKCE